MRKYVFNLVRKSPASIGLLSLLIALHLAGIKDLRTSMVTMPRELWYIFVSYVFCMVITVFILPKIGETKREKTVWSIVVSSVFILTIAAKIFVS